jgi:superfamily I DNA/RNA helicase
MQAVEVAWKDLAPSKPLPWERVELFHVMEVLERMETMQGIRSPRGTEAYEFANRTAALLRFPVEPVCHALFVDEAQDFGEPTLAYLTKLVKPSSTSGRNERSVNIFYDNAQNLYRRGTPTWSTLGLDMRGRSTVMKESFRSTRPITEFALNVLYRLQPPDSDPDHRELISRDLLDSEERNGRKWWNIRFNQVAGPAPEFHRFAERHEELDALVARIQRWVEDEGVRPADIRVLALDPGVRRQVVERINSQLRASGIQAAEQKRQQFSGGDNLIIVTTPHSFKGFESEIVAVIGADKFLASKDVEHGKARILASALYVAMTRARSVLYTSSIARSAGSPSAEIVDTLQLAIEDSGSPPKVAAACSPVEERLELVCRIGEQHRDWVADVASKYTLITGPILGADGAIVAEPLFWIQTQQQRHVCFEHQPSSFIADQLDDMRIGILQPGIAI